MKRTYKTKDIHIVFDEETGNLYKCNISGNHEVTVKNHSLVIDNVKIDFPSSSDPTPPDVLIIFLTGMSILSAMAGIALWGLG